LVDCIRQWHSVLYTWGCLNCIRYCVENESVQYVKMILYTSSYITNLWSVLKIAHPVQFFCALHRWLNCLRISLTYPVFLIAWIHFINHLSVYLCGMRFWLIFVIVFAFCNSPFIWVISPIRFGLSVIGKCISKNFSTSIIWC